MEDWRERRRQKKKKRDGNQQQEPRLGRVQRLAVKKQERKKAKEVRQQGFCVDITPVSDGAATINVVPSVIGGVASGAGVRARVVRGSDARAARPAAAQTREDDRRRTETWSTTTPPHRDPDGGRRGGGGRRRDQGEGEKGAGST